MSTSLCASCGEPASLSCSRCKLVIYCNVHCQARDWPTHKDPCKAAAVASRVITTAAAVDSLARLPTFIIRHRISNDQLVLPVVKMTLSGLESGQVCATTLYQQGGKSIVNIDSPKATLLSVVALWAVCLSKVPDKMTLWMDLLDANGCILIEGAENPDSLEIYIREAWGMPRPDW